MPLNNLINRAMVPGGGYNAATTAAQTGYNMSDISGAANANVGLNTSAGINASVQLTGVMVALLVGAIVIMAVKWPV